MKIQTQSLSQVQQCWAAHVSPEQANLTLATKLATSKPFLSGLLPKAFCLAVGFWLAAPPSLQAQSPPAGNLQLWLKADAGVSLDITNGVTVWADQSGNARHAVLPGGAAAPVFITSDADLGGKPTVQFNTGQYVELTNTLDIVGDLSSFAVVKLHSQTANYRGVWDQSPSSGPGVGYPYPNQWMIYIDGLSTLQRGDGPGVAYDDAFSSVAVPLTNYVALGFTAAGSIVNFYKNDSADGSDIIEPSVTIEGGGVPIRIGARYPSGGNPLNGEVAELLIYDAALSGDDRTNLWVYLANKYGLVHQVTVDLSTDHPSPIAAPSTVIATADVSLVGASLVRVDFFANEIKVGSISTPPYKFPLNVLNSGTLTLKAVAVDSLGLSTVSAPSVLTVTGATPTFTADTNLVLWLKADAGVTTNGSGQVMGWADQTTNLNNAVPGALGNPPTFVNSSINGKPAVHLDGTNFEYLDVAHSASISITGDISAVMVMNVPAEQLANYRFPFYKGGLNGYPSPNGLMLWPGGQPTVNRGTGDGMTQDLFMGNQSVPGGQYSIVFFNQAGTAASQFLNAVPNGMGTATVTPVDTELGPLHIGTRGNLYSYLTADIAEMMMFNSAVSGTDLDNLQNYLGAKYGVALAVQAPNSPPTIAITSPANASSAAVPANLTVNATASDTDGAVANVELFANGFSFGLRSGPPYQWFLRVKTPGSVSLAAVATDNLGAKSTNTVTITTTGTAPTFTANTNLVLWLKADAGVTTNDSGGVTAWADQSAYANNATAPLGTPTFMANVINGGPAIHFDNTLASYLTVPHSASLAITGNVASFVVLNPNSANSGNYRMIWFQGNSYPSPNGFMMVPGNQPTPCRGNEGIPTQDLFGALRSPAALEYSILGFSAAGNTVRQYLNGIENGDPSTGNIVPADTGSPLYIGTRGDFYSYLRAELAELMIFNSALAGADLDGVREYLGNKYGIMIVEKSGPPPTLTIEGLGNGTVKISWPVSFSGYVLESASSLPAVSWGTVSGVLNNQVTVTPVGQTFYRLRLP